LLLVCAIVINVIKQRNFLFQFHGFTCGVDDLILHQESDVNRKKILESSEKENEEIHRWFTRTEGDLEGLWNASFTFIM
jgi:hypothetical protein